MAPRKNIEKNKTPAAKKSKSSTLVNSENTKDCLFSIDTAKNTTTGNKANRTITKKKNIKKPKEEKKFQKKSKRHTFIPIRLIDEVAHLALARKNCANLGTITTTTKANTDIEKPKTKKTTKKSNIDVKKLNAKKTTKKSNTVDKPNKPKTKKTIKKLPIKELKRSKSKYVSPSSSTTDIAELGALIEANISEKSRKKNTTSKVKETPKNNTIKNTEYERQTPKPLASLYNYRETIEMSSSEKSVSLITASDNIVIDGKIPFVSLNKENVHKYTQNDALKVLYEDLKCSSSSSLSQLSDTTSTTSSDESSRSENSVDIETNDPAHFDLDWLDDICDGDDESDMFMNSLNVNLSLELQLLKLCHEADSVSKDLENDLFLKPLAERLENTSPVNSSSSSEVYVKSPILRCSQPFIIPKPVNKLHQECDSNDYLSFEKIETPNIPKHVEKTHQKGYSVDRLLLFEKKEPRNLPKHVEKPHQEGFSDDRLSLFEKREACNIPKLVEKRHQEDYSDDRLSLFEKREPLNIPKHLEKLHQEGYSGDRLSLFEKREPHTIPKHVEKPHQEDYSNDRLSLFKKREPRNMPKLVEKRHQEDYSNDRLSLFKKREPLNIPKLVKKTHQESYSDDSLSLFEKRKPKRVEKLQQEDKYDKNKLLNIPKPVKELHQEDDDDDCLSLFENSIEDPLWSDVSENNDKPVKEDPKQIKREEIVVPICKKQNTNKICIEYTSSQYSDDNANIKSTSVKLPSSEYTAVSLIKSKLFHGFCIFHVIGTCRHTTCRFQHTEPPMSLIKCRIITLQNIDFIREYKFVRGNYSLRKYIPMFIQDCIRRSMWDLLIEMAVDNRKNRSHLETILLGLACTDMSQTKLLDYKIDENFLVCDLLMEALSASDHLLPLSYLFIQLTLFFNSIKRNYNINWAVLLLERVSIPAVPYHKPLAEAMLKVIFNTDIEILNNEYLGVFLNNIKRFPVLYEELKRYIEDKSMGKLYEHYKRDTLLI